MRYYVTGTTARPGSRKHYHRNGDRKYSRLRSSLFGQEVAKTLQLSSRQLGGQ